MLKVYQLGLFSTNCYIYKDYIIDPAADDFPSDFDFSSIKAVLLTHGHLDHIAGLHRILNERPDMPVYIHYRDKDAVSENKLQYHKEMFGPFGQDIVNQMLTHFDANDVRFIETADDIPFTIIETPGHTPGSVCILDEEEKVLFSGDTLFAGGIGRTDLKSGSYEQLSRSLEKLKQLDPDIRVYSGHGEVTTIKNELR